MKEIKTHLGYSKNIFLQKDKVIFIKYTVDSGLQNIIMIILYYFLLFKKQ